MTRTSTTTLALTVAVLALGFTGVFAAGDMGTDDTTHLTFAHPVRIPGVTLPAGAYVFQLNQNRQAVWVRSADGGDVFGSYLVRSRHRTRETHKRVVVLERAAGSEAPPTIRAWFGRGRSHGFEFVYPRTES